jgi:hypothetical protein
MHRRPNAGPISWSAAHTDPINDDGPNTGTVPTGFYWVIVPDPENTMSEFFLRQCRNFDPATQTGFISGEHLATQTVRHESGVSQNHHAHYVAA